MRRLQSFACAAAVAVAAMASLPVVAQEAEHAQPTHFPMELPEPQSWSFAGFFGSFNEAQLQRGFQVYKEVCASCHALSYIAFRNLGDEGGPHFGEEEVKALAAEYTVGDGPDESGDMFERPGIPSDRVPSPFPNDKAAAASNGGSVPPDLSLIAKARAASPGIFWTLLDFFTQYQEAGPDYLHALLTGYQEPPEGVDVPEETYFNPYFLAAVSLKMPPPLSEEQVTYEDGSPETIDQYSRDVSAFLMWAAEPHLVERKRMGFQVVIFLLVFAGLMYLTKKKVWSDVAH